MACLPPGLRLAVLLPRRAHRRGVTPVAKIAAPIPSAEAKNNPFLPLFRAIRIHLTQKRCRAEQKRLVWGARGAGKERCRQKAWLWRFGGLEAWSSQTNPAAAPSHPARWALLEAQRWLKHPKAHELGHPPTFRAPRLAITGGGSLSLWSCSTPGL